MKKGLLIALSLFALVACNDKTEQPKKETTVTLTEQEKKIANGDQNVGVKLLLRKAVLVDGRQSQLTDDEKIALQSAKDDAEAVFYLQQKIGKELNVTEADVVDFYNANKDKLQGEDPKIVYNQIANFLVQQQENQKVADYYNELVKKYKLDDVLKKEFPQPAAKEEVQPTTEKPADGAKN